MGVMKCYLKIYILIKSSTDQEDLSKPIKANLITLGELNRMFNNHSAFGPQNEANIVRSERDTASVSKFKKVFVHKKEMV